MDDMRAGLPRAFSDPPLAAWGRPTCPTCGADLQAETRRCPWAKAGAVPGIDGNTYCSWPRANRPDNNYMVGYSRRRRS
jgi:hypothetical protein